MTSGSQPQYQTWMLYQLYQEAVLYFDNLCDTYQPCCYLRRMPNFKIGKCWHSIWHDQQSTTLTSYHHHHHPPQPPSLPPLLHHHHHLIVGIINGCYSLLSAHALNHHSKKVEAAPCHQPKELATLVVLVPVLETNLASTVKIGLKWKQCVLCDVKLTEKVKWEYSNATELRNLMPEACFLIDLTLCIGFSLVTGQPNIC